MRKPVVQILVGMIASGKSTYARFAAATGAVIVNDDDIVMALHGGNYDGYQDALKPLYKSIENNIVTTAVALGRDVVVDRGLNVSALARSRWLSLARSLDVPCEAVVFPVESPAVHATRRSRHDDRGLSFEAWLSVAQKHAQQYCQPRAEEGFAGVFDVEFERDVATGALAGRLHQVNSLGHHYAES